MTVSLTLFCDASFCPNTRAAGWGAWAKRDGWTEGLIFGGGFKHLLKSSHEAELGAIANALHQLGAADHLAGLSSVMVQSDSLRALGVVHANVRQAVVNDHGDGAKVPLLTRSDVSEAERIALEIISNSVCRWGLFLQLRHVRGHQRGASRHWVNRQCDATAKKYMRQSRSAQNNRKEV